MKGICWYHIWSYKNTNLLNVCVVLFIFHIISMYIKYLVYTIVDDIY